MPIGFGMRKNIFLAPNFAGGGSNVNPFGWLLEDGTGYWLLEEGTGIWLTEEST